MTYLTNLWKIVKLGLFLTFAGWTALAIFAATFGSLVFIPVIGIPFLILLSPLLLGFAVAGPFWLLIAPFAALEKTA
jgi:hypothetical protein